MNIAPVAYRYARSLMDLATEQGQADAVYADMELVAGTTAASRDLRVLLNSPVVKADKKSAVLGKLFAGQVGEVTQRFMDILVRKGREAMLPQVAAAVQQLYKQQKGIITAEVTSARPSPSTRAISSPTSCRLPSPSWSISGLSGAAPAR